MELQHTFTVPAPAPQMWDLFMDLPAVARCFPGATVTGVEGDTFEGTCKVKLGPIALLYAGSGTFVERDDTGFRAVIKATGKDKRGNGTAGATVTISLTPDGDLSTAVDVTTDLSVTGKPAQFGRGVMQDVSDKLLQQFVDCLEQRFVSPGAAPSAEATTPAEATTAADATTPEARPTAAAPPEASSLASQSQSVRPPGPAPAPGAAPARHPATEPDDSLDLGSAVAMAVLRSYAPHLLAALAGALVGVWIGRHTRRG